MASTSSYQLRGSTSADTSVQWKYDVFLSFRGEDTRQKFTAHLYDKLVSRGIRTFRDDPDLERGKAISPELLAAIEQSRFAVVVLSPNYASSKWCLMELVKIVQCMGERGTIVPVFYEVDPSDVRHQKGTFAAAFAEHEKKFGKPSEEDSRKLQEWRDTLTKVANLAGWTSKDYSRDESYLIRAIVDALLKEMHPTIVSTEKLVGTDSRLMELDYLIRTKSTNTSDTCFIGIWGLGGIGKTTLAKQVYHKISHKFEVSIFLPDVRRLVSAKHQQEQLLCQIPNEKNTQIQTVDDGVAKIRRSLFSKKVLLVLDDVDQLDQLENLAGGKDWFGSGSIIIITTRNQQLLVWHDVEIQYKSRGLNEDEALQYLSWRAFKKDKPAEGYMDLCKSILDYAGGLPLALRTLGSFLLKRNRDDWVSTVTTLKKAPQDGIFKVLKISYDGLDEMCQQVFLDIVFFLKGYDKERVIQILNSVFNFDTRIKINVLVENSLLTTCDNCVDMHDLIQEMGQEIVRLECKENPGKRSRLWRRDDVFRVLKQNVGTETIKSIALCLPESEELAWNPNAFSKMSELKYLKIQNLVLRQGPESLPDAIRVLNWTSYPSKSLPLDFQPVELIELILRHSKIDQLWDGKKFLEMLTHIDLSYSENLVMTPDFTGIPNLERLALEGCTNLVDVHPSVISLKRLKILNVKNCRSIVNIPSEIKIDSLELIDFSGCSKVNIFPQFQSRMEKLSELSCGGIGMKTSEASSHSVRPHQLSLVFASSINFCSLKRLHLNDCKLGEGDIPDDIGCLSSLEELDLSVNNFVSLPASIGTLFKLKFLDLTDCMCLQELPYLPLFNGTFHLTADNCKSLKKFAYPLKLSELWKLCFNFINCWSIREVEPLLLWPWIDRGVQEGYGSTRILYSVLKRFLQEPPRFFEMFSIVIPGDDIPVWFKIQNEGNSVTQQEEYLERGYALCVLFGIEENPGAFDEDHANTISCSWQPGLYVPASFSFNLNQVVNSDHLCVFLLPSKHFPPCYSKLSIKFSFEAAASLKVKKCGVRKV